MDFFHHSLIGQNENGLEVTEAASNFYDGKSIKYDVNK